MKKYIWHALIFVALTAPALAQEMPAPRKMPRTPVDRETVTQQRKTAIPASHELQGQALIVDSEKLRLGEFDLRLFGIVPPQLSASFGPQARAALDQLTAAQTISCLIRDRDREGRFLATCHNANNADLALELLKRGLAVAARGSLGATDLAAPYIAAEQAAEAQKTGLWSVTAPAAAVVPAAQKPAAATTTSVPSTVATLAPAGSALPVPAAMPQGTEDKPVEIAVKPKTPDLFAVKPLLAPEPIKSTIAEDEKSSVSAEPGFLMRYQLLITGLVMLATALGMLGAIAIQRIIDRRTEMKAIAAALRGELMAARAVFFGRLKTSADVEDKDIAWPRIRSTLYNAYVGRLGWLGAELARRVASIYGQANDYASYYEGNDETRANAVPKRQALQTVIGHIDGILPRLTIIEQTGSAAASETVALPKQAINEPVVPPIPTPQITPMESRSVSTAAIVPPVIRIWDKVRDVAWGKKVPSSPDPVAEYTALIEEEMKRFAFDEGEGDHESSDSSVTKLHG